VSNVEPSYDAHGFHPGLAEGVPGRLTLGEWALRFESEAGSVTFPLQELRIDFDADSGRVLFNHPKHRDWTLATAEQQILEERPFTQRTHLRNQIADLVEQQRPWRKLVFMTLWFFAGFGLLALLVSALSGWMVRSLVARVPVSWEQKLGDALFDELKAKKKFSKNPKRTTQLNTVTEPLLTGVKRRGVPFKFHVVEDPLPNAQALPGGHVFVHTGLLELVDTPEELAGVLAHEIAHVTERHGFRQIISALGPLLLLKFMVRDDNGLLGVLSGGSHALIQQRFSKDYEREADDVGWNYLLAANINPRGAIDLFMKLKLEQQSLGLETDRLQALSSHPPTAERIARLEKKWAKLRRKSGFIEFGKAEP
jgi:Zn-dependent protease with chaperone function